MRRETSALIAAAAVLGAARIGARYNPGPGQPRTATWYDRLDKPSFTPLGAVIGAAWTGLDFLLCVAGYRLLAAPPSPRRRTALGLWGLSVSGLAVWPYLFFGRKRLGESVVALGGMLAVAAGGGRRGGPRRYARGRCHRAAGRLARLRQFAERGDLAAELNPARSAVAPQSGATWTMRKTSSSPLGGRRVRYSPGRNRLSARFQSGSSASRSARNAQLRSSTRMSSPHHSSRCGHERRVRQGSGATK